MEPSRDFKSSVDLLPFDDLLLVSRKRYLNRPGGYGSGKTFFGAIWHHDRAMINRFGSMSWWLSKDHATARAGFDTYVDYLDRIDWQQGVDYKTRLSPEMEIEYRLIDHLVRFKTTNQTLQGDTISHKTTDESDECKPDKKRRAESRMRCPKAKLIQSLDIGSPQGLEHFYKHAVKADMRRHGEFGQFRENDNTLTLHYRTYWNHHIVQTGFFDTLWNEFGHDERFIKSWVFGVFLPLSQAQCYDFDPRRYEEGGHIVNVPYDPRNKTLITSWDFNMGNMAYVGYQIHNNDWIGKLECPPNTKNAEHACDRLIGQVPEHVARETTVYVDGDANGWAGTKHGLSCEYDLIEQRLSEHFQRVVVQTPNHNDAVAIRVMSTNRLFRQKRLLLDASLRQSSESFANTTWENSKIKKASGETVTHFSDAGSYAPSRAEQIGLGRGFTRLA